MDFTKATDGNQMEYRVFFYGVANTSLAVDSTEIEEIETQVTPEEFAYESENLGTIVGTTITDPSASNGAYISVDSTQSNGGTLQFGPYASNLEAGKNYKATFRLKTQNNSLNTHIALIDAFDDTTGFRAFKEIKASDFASNDTWQEFSVDFTKASTGNQMEYRVFFYGVADSSLAVDSTKVTKISSTTPTPDPDPVTPPTNTPAYSMVTYSYDATGRRFAKVVKDASGAILENISYTYAGEQVIEETSGTTQKAYFYGNAGVDDMVAFTQNNQTYFLHKDHLGSTLAISDISANIITTYDYDAYGNVSLTSGSQAFQNDRLFTGREYEKETGLYYYRARFYSPKTGRFLSRDPIGIQDDVNLYAYVGNNPVMFTDPSGMTKSAIVAPPKSAEEHYARNKLNTNLPKSPLEAMEEGWVLLPQEKSVFHSYGLPKGEFNYKFINSDGREAVYHYKTSELVTDENNMGTYNYYPPSDFINHTKYDVYPYYMHGNGENDTTTFGERISRTTEVTYGAYKNVELIQYNSERFNQQKFINEMINYFKY